ncbi:MAG: nucleotidyl transferase [Actinomycetota bacterium]|nr:nucleotidyl transferase [Actinomycetota bacterium]
MKRAEMIDAMAALGEDLKRRGVAAKLYIVGGAVMVLAHDSRDATMDVDGDFYPRDTVMEAAREIARLRDLPDDWLNAAANGFIPVFKSPEWRPLYRFGSLEVLAADDRTMLAMKIRASRGRRDEPDIAVLLISCGVTTVEQAFALYEEYFPEDPAPSRARTILEFLLSPEK